MLFNGTYNDFQPKPAELFERGVEFGLRALRRPGSRLLVHCTLGMHRAPAMALAILGAMGWPLPVAMQTIQKCRPVVYFADAYVDSVRECLEQRAWKQDPAAKLQSSPSSHPEPARTPVSLSEQSEPVDAA